MEKTAHIKITGLTFRQKEIINDIINTSTDKVKYHIIRASRKSGKSYLMEHLLFFDMVKHPKYEIGFMSATWNITMSFFRDFLKIVPPQLLKKVNTGSRIEFTNGSTVDFYSANSSITPVNRSFNELFMDEFGLYRKDVWDYLKPTIMAKPNAKVIVASTPRGKNAFYDMCQLGMRGEARHKEYRMHWRDNPLIHEEDVEDARKTMSTQLYEQEFECVFSDSMSGVFGKFGMVQTVKDWTGPQANMYYFYGVDVAGAGSDKTVITIIDSSGRVCLIYECKSDDLVIQGEEIYQQVHKYNAIGYVERNGIGAGLADILKNKGLNISYWNTSNESKQRIVTGLIMSINTGTVQLPTTSLCNELENELSNYSSKRTHSGLLTYNGEDGVHDDYVISLMLANEMFRMSGLQTAVGNSSEVRKSKTYSAEEIAEREWKRMSSLSNHSGGAYNSWADKIKYK